MISTRLFSISGVRASDGEFCLCLLANACRPVSGVQAGVVDQAAAPAIFTSSIDMAVVSCGQRRCSKLASGVINQTMCLSSRHWCHQAASGVIKQPVASSTSQWRHQAASGVIKQPVASSSSQWRHQAASGVIKQPVASPSSQCRERASGVWNGAAAPLKKFGIIGNQNVVVAWAFFWILK